MPTIARGRRPSQSASKDAAQILRSGTSKRTRTVAGRLLFSRNAGGRWSVKREGAKRASSTHDTREAAVAAATRLAADAAVVVAESAPTATDRLLELAGIDIDAGTRTTLKVPATLDDAARAIADEIGTSRNDALIRLAVAGARLVERARDAEEKRQARLTAVVAADAALAGDSYPSVDEMREAVAAVRATD